MSATTIHGDLFPVGMYARKHRYILPYQFNNFPGKEFEKFDFNQTYWSDEHLIVFFDYDEKTTEDEFKEIILNAPNKGILNSPRYDIENVKREMTSFKIIGKIENKTFCLMKTEIFRKEKDIWISDKEKYK